ncbi:hypothetical protein ACSBR1_006081 [Camellia fascicularis]
MELFRCAPDLSKISFERSFSSRSLRGELHPVFWRRLGGCSMFWVVNIGASTVGVFGVWIEKDESDHGSGDSSGSCSVGSGAGCGAFSNHGSGAGCGACGMSLVGLGWVRSVRNEREFGAKHAERVRPWK